MISAELLEGARDGRSVADLMSFGATILKRDDVMASVPELMRQAGVVGAGGGFPTYVKYKEPQPCLLVNATESEPGYRADRYLKPTTALVAPGDEVGCGQKIGSPAVGSFSMGVWASMRGTVSSVEDGIVALEGGALPQEQAEVEAEAEVRR